MKKNIAYVFIGAGIFTILFAVFVAWDVHQRQIARGGGDYDELALFGSIAIFGGFFINAGCNKLRK